MAVTNLVKRIQDIMRNDAGVDGDAQRISQMTWMFFLKVYDAKESFIMDIEAFDGKHNTHTVEAHYDAIAKKVPTSIPQIRRDFTTRFSNGVRYLEAP